MAVEVCPGSCCLVVSLQRQSRSSTRTASGLLRSCCSRPSWPWYSLGALMEAFSTVEALAAASLDEARLQWQGLGYYSRARRLHEASQLLVGGPWPRTLAEWTALPGIGRTTAGSILSSAFNAPLPILDGNARRVLARLTAHRRPPARDDALLGAGARPARFGSATGYQPSADGFGGHALHAAFSSAIAAPGNPTGAAYAAGDPCRWPRTTPPRPCLFR